MAVATELDELYQHDFYAWALSQAGELRRLGELRPNAGLDIDHLVEEIEALASNDLNTVLSQLERLIQHLLKLEHSPSAGPRRQWRITVNDARREIGRRLTKAMRPTVEAELDDLYRHGRENARLELLDYAERDAAEALPAHLPYTLEQLLDAAWYPASQHGFTDDA